MGTELRERILWSTVVLVVVGILFVFAAMSWVRPLIGLGVIGVVSVGLWEYYRLSIARGHTPPVKIAIGSGVAYVAVAYFSSQGQLPYFAQLAMLALIFALFFLSFFFSKSSDKIGDLAIAFFGIVYVAVSFSTILNMLYLDGRSRIGVGQWWVVLVILTTVATDIGAYFVGKRYGKRKLAPTLSPGKTWEGAFGGLGCALVMSLFMGLIGRVFQPVWVSLLLGFIIGIVAQIGDLAESLLKRGAGVKDSNRLPGLGGVLDVVDGLLFTLPFGFLAQQFILWVFHGRIPCG